ncbi:MAG TPA: serine/threonine-protein kinase, partial [Polyangiaceae bacterium]|nr:serine/threonine-protein kinase [Polyangiaceae bacterium]
MNSAPTIQQNDGGAQAGQVLGRYELLLPIAAGGMAMVWAARMRGTRGFQKIVAVKTMLPKLSEDAQFEQMFLDEASLASQIRHPNAVEILDLGEQGGILYLVMEWIEGVPLNQLMKAAKRQGGVPAKVAVRIAMQTCAGLHAAHELKDTNGNLVGLVHRDVSPQNILVTFDGVTKVVDFGVAKATAAGDGATQAGQIKGKVGYMAPEQVRGEPIDRRVDVFALGIVLYALTTGKHPFRRESEAATMYNICAPQAVMPPSKVVPNYPAELEAVIMKALEKDRDKRFASANEVLKALDKLPEDLRATTDHDVGEFVQSLLGARREERKRALSEALERADLQAQTQSGTRQAIQTGSSGQNRAIADVGSGITSGNLDSGPDFGGVKRPRLLLGAAAGALILAGAIAYAMVGSDKPPPQTESVAQQPKISASPTAPRPATDSE